MHRDLASLGRVYAEAPLIPFRVSGTCTAHQRTRRSAARPTTGLQGPYCSSSIVPPVGLVLIFRSPHLSGGRGFDCTHIPRSQDCENASETPTIDCCYPSFLSSLLDRGEVGRKPSPSSTSDIVSSVSRTYRRPQLWSLLSRHPQRLWRPR